MEDESTTKVAACPLFYWAYGGLISEQGQPLKPNGVLYRKKEFYKSCVKLKLLCPDAYDCGRCPHLHRWLEVQQSLGFSFGWECYRCIKQSHERNEDKNLEILVTGYYQAGRNPLLTREDKDFDADRPALSGCTRVFEEDDLEVDKRAGDTCNWESSFLQLVLRRGKT